MALIDSILLFNKAYDVARPYGDGCERGLTLGDLARLLDGLPTIELRCEECEAFNKTRLLIPQPERKKGKWIVGANHGLMVHTLTCDQCNHSEVSSSVPNFCPNCGADMRGEQDG